MRKDTINQRVRDMMHINTNSSNNCQTIKKKRRGCKSHHKRVKSEIGGERGDKLRKRFEKSLKSGKFK